MKEDNEMLDAAIDAALLEADERSKSSESNTSAKETEAHDEPTGDESSQEAPEKEETDLDQEADEAATPEDEAPEPQAAQSLAAPVHWSPERAAVFQKAPREVQEIILQREQELERKLQQATANRSNEKALEQRFYADFESPEAINLHKSKLAASGINDPIAELHRYRAWDRVFEADPYTAISHLMRKNGLTPYDFTNEANNEPESQYQDPRVDDAIKRAEEAEKRVVEFEKKQEEARFAGVVNAYKSGNFGDGTPRAKFVSVYAPQITQAYDALSKHPDYQHLDEANRLHYATEFVRSQVNELHGVKPEVKKELPKKTREQIIEESKKAQAAASATTGAPNTASLSASKKPRLKGKTDSERVGNAIDMALDRAYGMQ